jgi:hypothetical protein
MLQEYSDWHKGFFSQYEIAQIDAQYDAIEKVKKFGNLKFSEEAMKEILSFISWGYEENEQGAKLLISLWDLDEKELKAFCPLDDFIEYMREEESNHFYDDTEI